MRRREFKQTALCLALLFLLSIGLMTIRAEGHSLNHEESADHAARHASSICAWMCSASTFVDSVEKDPTERFYPSPETLVVLTRHFFSRPPVFSFHIRPPPSSSVDSD
ncbi:hypothetical protein [Candidatus Manganitrophus noduliformans]|uniref:Uncharacterized protein n=1 Tax=Candidatus Manganitrophus noduliformans TaxID=2606439 RepID=A0A7X6IDK8_9BACT|nr:hypothetical protein [Candidatus Manganitrophus noduliformans]NKE73509.1 hypothetical protein [Candidatus Manganitrophus noduliformans]